MTSIPVFTMSLTFRAARAAPWARETSAIRLPLTATHRAQDASASRTAGTISSAKMRD